MQLVKIEPVEFGTQLRTLEFEAVTRAKCRNSDLVRGVAGLLAGGGAGMAVFLATLLAAIALGPSLGAWTILLAVVGSVLTVGAGAFAGVRYLSPPERRRLGLILESDAKSFLESNWDRRERLLAETAAFNEAIQAFRALPERAGEDEIDVGLAANLAERRARIEAENQAYLAEFRAATEAERGRVAKLNVVRGKSMSPHKRSLRDFKRKVRQLARMERSLEGFLDSVGGGTTVDLSPYQAVLRFREELEEERATLLRCGLSPKKLPTPRVGKKFLPART